MVGKNPWKAQKPLVVSGPCQRKLFWNGHYKLSCEMPSVGVVNGCFCSPYSSFTRKLSFYIDFLTFHFDTLADAPIAVITLEFFTSLWQMWQILGTVACSCWLRPGGVSVLPCRQRASGVLGISPHYWGKRRVSGRWWTSVFLPCWTIHDDDKVSGIKRIF